MSDHRPARRARDIDHALELVSRWLDEKRSMIIEVEKGDGGIFVRQRPPNDGTGDVREYRTPEEVLADARDAALADGDA